MDVTVCVATFGDRSWTELALERAVPSVEAEHVPLIYAHHATDLHEARNAALDEVRSEWVCFLDADDELEPGYFAAMETGTADLRAPAVRYVRRATQHVVPRVPTVAGHGHACVADCLADGNWLVIGTVARTSIVRRAGGFRDFSWSEDWDLWVRCWQAGATVEAIPSAVYRAYVRKDSRNRAPDRHSRLAAHQAIARANGLPVPA